MRNGDGGIQPKKFYDQQNKSGAVEPGEFYAAVGAKDTSAPSPKDKDYKTAPGFKKRGKNFFGSTMEAFASLDADDDGKVTPEELVAGAAKMKSPISKEEALILAPQLDENGGGVLSAHEFYD